MPASSRSEIFAVSTKAARGTAANHKKLKKPECRMTVHAVFYNSIFIIYH
jgi:hypothetical protein